MRLSVNTNHIKSIITGDNNCFGVVYDVWAVEMTMYALSILKDTEEAKDAVMQTFLKVMHFTADEREQRMPQDDTGFKAWLIVVLRNVCLDINKRKQTGLKYEQANTLLNNFVPQHDMQMDMKNAFKQIDALPETHKEPFKMYVQGYNRNEIAEYLNLNVNTVKNRLSQSKKQFLKFIQNGTFVCIISLIINQ